MNFKINFLAFLFLIIFHFQNFTSISSSYFAQPNIGQAYSIPELPKQDKSYTNSTILPSISNLWGLFTNFSTVNAHDEIRRIIQLGQIDSACEITALEKNDNTITTRFPNFAIILASITNENCNNLRKATQKQERDATAMLEEQRKELANLIGIIALQFQALKFNSTTQPILHQNRSLFQQAIDECINKEQKIQNSLMAESQARIQALQNIRDLLGT
ncbi:hypothetical protein HYV10_00550 [Candidatus Dependentiae bacterium]|nr:hypothetical protein [Candidatus Dependentiae bacterium]